MLGGLAACTAGNGSGAADGELFVTACNDGQPYGGTPGMHPFSLEPTFFAGESIEDISLANTSNRLIIRLQRQGTHIEVNDILYVDVRDVKQIARCVRGVDDDGAPDKTAYPWCDWTRSRCCAAGDAACLAINSPCVELGPRLPLSSYLQVRYTCSQGSIPGAGVNVVGVAVTDDPNADPPVTTTRYSWIAFSDFGGVLPDTAAQGGIATDFKIDYGNRLWADFHVDIEDDRVVTAIQDEEPLIPTALIGGWLDGRFDFDLDRGRAAQLFP